MSDRDRRARARAAAASGDPEAEARVERDLARCAVYGWEQYVGHWVYVETPTMHWRGKCVGVVPGQHGALALSPAIRVHDWQEQPTDAAVMPSSPPAMIPLGAICYAGLQSPAWPTVTPARKSRGRGQRGA